MGRWVKIAIADVASYQAGALVKALESKAKYSDAQENPLNVAIERITARIRSDVKSGGFSVDVDAAKIPGELTADEVNLANAARARLDKIAEGKIKPSLPDNPEPAAASVQASSGCQLVRPARGVPQRGDYNGL